MPNYTPDGVTRRITYFKECDEKRDCKKSGITELTYETTPPTMPVGFDLRELDYRGSYM